MRIAARLVLAALPLVATPLGLRAAVAGEPPAGPSSPASAAARGFLGFHVEPMPMLSAAQKAALGATGDKGVVVALVIPDGPAARAGMKVGDFLIRFGGRDVPQETTLDRYAPAHHEWRVAMRERMAAVKAGEPVEAVVERAGKQVPLSITPVAEPEMHRMLGGDTTPLPAIADAGPATALTERFDTVPAGASLPLGFSPYEGRWKVVADPGADNRNAVLRQDLPVLPWAPLLVTGKGRAFASGHASVRFLPVSGVADASGGVVFRAQGGRDYYLARANALEDNFGIYVLKDGVRTELRAVRVTPPALGAWHTIDVWFSGESFRATLDGKDPVESKDGTYATGWCGLWTKADSVTLFDDFSVTPGDAPTK